jgi:hypothetical protein
MGAPRVAQDQEFAGRKEARNAITVLAKKEREPVTEWECLTVGLSCITPVWRPSPPTHGGAHFC